jgi:hypothetical protein
MLRHSNYYNRKISKGILFSGHPGCLPFTWKAIRFELNREDPGTGEKIKKM